MSYWSEVKELFLKGVDLALANFKDTAESAIEKGKVCLARREGPLSRKIEGRLQ